MKTEGKPAFLYGQNRQRAKPGYLRTIFNLQRGPGFGILPELHEGQRGVRMDMLPLWCVSNVKD